MSVEQKTVSLPFKIKFSYSMGQIGDALGYNIYFFFFLFFLTDYVGVPPALAGTISLIAIIWDAIFDPVAGHISDNMRSPYGRRRPLMIMAALPYSIFAFLIFNSIALGTQATFIYFLVMTILFWSSYKFFVIPYFALGAELTDDFNERTTLRAWSSVGLYIAVMLASALPPYLLEYFENSGMSGQNSWRIIGAIFASGILLSAVICWNFTRGKEIYQHDQQAKQKMARSSLFKAIGQIIKLKPTKYLAGSVFFWAIASTMAMGGLIYLMKYNLGYGADRQSLYFIINSLVCIAWLPFINMAARRYDKKMVYACFLGIGSLGLLFFSLTGFPLFAILLIFCVIFCLGDSTYWTLYYSMMYDICEVDEYVNNRRREGVVTAVMSFSQKIGAACATWFTGLLLAFGGYEGTVETQTDSAHQMILYVNTLVPGVFGALAVLAVLFYPVTKKRFDSMMVALNAKRENKAYDDTDFKEML
ncbi:MFS transporter [Brochothrix campestris]|uniref:Sugar (Glycoside-Pentoside-hexuronide) transporter n=1 Tax=Brochothrix campestris FSL F6-1037 TaxID=1265861 RepID=W7D4Z4_9LIST|nr:MFS transporter [Brochothrix campestris]EUJ40333.1 sugar (glycoside-Pentoside-hexuronide) transporter [Brochothrix campestris FSL F6-1037]